MVQPPASHSVERYNVQIAHAVNGGLLVNESTRWADCDVHTLVTARLNDRRAALASRKLRMNTSQRGDDTDQAEKSSSIQSKYREAAKLVSPSPLVWIH
eukprot:4240063-Pleurochrysis_carterae.AAC.3